MIIAPSILSSDFSKLGSEVQMLNNSKAEWIHIDVMDGVFVPNISFGFPVLHAIRKQTTKVCDVHLMIVHPERYVKAFAQAGADCISFHFEATPHHDSLLREIRSLGKKAGLAINPSTSVNLLSDILPLVDVLLVMSVNPGFGGQKFIDYSTDKVRQTRQLIDRIGCNTKIEVDGGVDLQNAVELKQAGADILVAGNTVFSANKPAEMIAALMAV